MHLFSLTATLGMNKVFYKCKLLFRAPNFEGGLTGPMETYEERLVWGKHIPRIQTV